MNKKIIVSAIVIVIAFVAILVVFKNQKSSSYDRQIVPVVPNTQTSATTTAAQIYSLAEVAKHASATSCWTAVRAQVYDLTSWISEHPGGESAILGMCGRDGTQDFMDQHGGQGRPERELAKYNIGSLAQ
jgi:cytochrome b involved in lipid metabolism